MQQHAHLPNRKAALYQSTAAIHALIQCITASVRKFRVVSPYVAPEANKALADKTIPGPRQAGSVFRQALDWHLLAPAHEQTAKAVQVAVPGTGQQALR